RQARVDHRAGVRAGYARHHAAAARAVGRDRARRGRPVGAHRRRATGGAGRRRASRVPRRAARRDLVVVTLSVVHPGPPGAEGLYPYKSQPQEGARVQMHRNAKTTPKGRAVLVERIRTQQWSVPKAAAASGVSTRTAYKWLARFRDGGLAALEDRA